jgi:SAM-dependent methyltransferase
MKQAAAPIKYFGDVDDPMWQFEVIKLLPWLYGKGADIGCGGRSIFKEVLRVDIDPAVGPDIVASGDKLPFKDGELDFISAIHAFEHFPDVKKLLTEWLRVIRSGGMIGIVHPDVSFTKPQKLPENNPSLKGNPHNKHYYEHTQESFLKFLASLADLPFIIVDYGVGCPNWSFYVILRKK